MSDVVLIKVKIPKQLWEDAVRYGVDFDEVARDVSDFAILYLISLVAGVGETRWRYFQG